MPRAKRLNGIAHELLGIFLSRNNDVGGYWGRGVLLRDTLESTSEQGVVMLDLVGSLAQPETTAAMHIREAFARRFSTSLLREGFAPADVDRAHIRVHFPEKEAPTCFGPGRRTACQVLIVDARGRKHEANGFTACVPHSTRERRRIAEG